MEKDVEIQDLRAEQLSALLRSGASDLSPHEARAVLGFVRRIGGMENALAAAEMLNEMEDSG